MLEHGINVDGTRVTETPLCGDSSCETMFSKTSTGRYVPHSIFVDLEPSVIDTVRNAPTGRIGKEIDNSVIGQIEKLAEECDGLSRFLIFHSLGGGTGSGFTSLLLERINNEYSKKCKLAFAVFPSPILFCYEITCQKINPVFHSKNLENLESAV